MLQIFPNFVNFYVVGELVRNRGQSFRLRQNCTCQQIAQHWLRTDIAAGKSTRLRAPRFCVSLPVDVEDLLDAP